MSQKSIPILDFDALITAIQALSAPSGTDVAISPTGMHIVTEDDVQGAISELDAKAYEINSSLTYKLVDSKVGDSAIALPANYETIIIQTYTSSALNYTIEIPKIMLSNSVQKFCVGSTIADVRLDVTDAYVNLKIFNYQGTSYLSSATTTVYYR